MVCQTPEKRFEYARRELEKTALYQVLDRHLDAWLMSFAERDQDVPAFVERELRAFLRCGRLEHGFARVRCVDCGADRLVAFSCKKRGFCPSCGARRMAETAAHWRDAVIPAVPMRQWVLSLPFRLRLILAFDHRLLSRVLAAFLRAVHAWQHQKLREVYGRRGGHPGALTVVQRFGGALNLNVHFHSLIPDGVWVESGEDETRFLRLPPPSDEEVQWVLASAARRISRVLRVHGDLDDGDSPRWMLESVAARGPQHSAVCDRLTLSARLFSSPPAGGRVPPYGAC